MSPLRLLERSSRIGTERQSSPDGCYGNALPIRPGHARRNSQPDYAFRIRHCYCGRNGFPAARLPITAVSWSGRSLPLLARLRPTEGARPPALPVRVEVIPSGRRLTCRRGSLRRASLSVELVVASSSGPDAPREYTPTVGPHVPDQTYDSSHHHDGDESAVHAMRLLSDLPGMDHCVSWASTYWLPPRQASTPFDSRLPA